MFRHGQLTKSLILSFAWIMTCISFYALSLNSSDLSGDIVLNFFLARSTNCITALYFLTSSHYIGRKYSLSLSLTLLGTSCIILAFLPKSYKAAVLGVYLGASTVAAACKLCLAKIFISGNTVDGQTYRKYFIVSRAYSNFLTFILRVYFPEGLLSRGLTLI